jgi:hypothetical protein
MGAIVARADWRCDGPGVRASRPVAANAEGLDRLSDRSEIISIVCSRFRFYKLS